MSQVNDDPRDRVRSFRLSSTSPVTPAPSDAPGWNAHWATALRGRGPHPLEFFVRDDDLVDLMRAEGLRTVLCVGNGLSQEPRALALGGFDVTVLDVSATAIDAARDASLPLRFLAAHIGDRTAGTPGRIDWVVGDLLDTTLCPGPFDVVIERRTLQTWPAAARSPAVEAVAGRLGPRGLLLTEACDDTWRPQAPLSHALAPWFDAHGWTVWQPGHALEGRAVWLQSATAWPGSSERACGDADFEQRLREALGGVGRGVRGVGC